MNHGQTHKAGLDIDACPGQVATSDSVEQVHNPGHLSHRQVYAVAI